MHPLHPTFLDTWSPFFKDYGSSVIALVTAFIAAGITWYWQGRQNAVAREVKNIAQNQHVVAQTKLNLDLFEKKFAAYREVLASIHEFQVYSSHLDEQMRDKLIVNYVYSIQPIKYLFNIEIFNFLNGDFKELLRDYIDHMDLLQTVERNTLQRTHYGLILGNTANAIKESIEEFDDKVYPLLKIKD